MAVRTIANGGGNWSAPGTWVEGFVPTSADDVVATATSGNVTIDVASVCRSIDLTGYTGTLTHNAGVSLSIGDATAGAGNIALKFVPGMNYVLGDIATSSINFVSTSATVQSVDFGGKNSGDVNYNATSNGSWQLVSTHSTDYGAKITLTKGTLDINGQTCNWGAFNSDNSNVRSLILGNASIFLNGGGVIGNTFWLTSITTNLTIPANTASVTITKHSTSNAPLFFTNTFNFNGMSLYFTGGGIMTVRGTGTFYNLSFTGSATPPEDRYQLNTNVVVTNQLTLNGHSAVKRLRVHSNSFGSLRTITIAGATVVASNVNFNWISLSVLTDLSAIPGGAGDMGGNVNIIFTTAITNYWYSPTAGEKLWTDVTNWFNGSGGTGGNSRVPLPQDDIRFDASSFPVIDIIVRTEYPVLGTNIDWTGTTNNPRWHVTDDLTLNGVSIYGSITLVAGMTLTNSPTTSILWRGSGAGNTFTLTNAGHSWLVSLFLVNFAATNTLSLQDDFNCGTGLLQVTGIITTNNYNVTAGRFVQSSGTLNMGSSTFKVVNNGTAWSAAGTVNAGTSTIRISSSNDLQKTFAGGSKTYYNLVIEGSQSCTYNITGTNTFNDITSLKTVSFNLLFTAGTTTTVTTFNVNGSAGNLVTLSSTTAANHTLTKSGGGTITCDYMYISRSTATPGATWFATNSIDGGGNSGWNGLTTNPFTWTGATDSNFNTPTNWFGGSAPGPTDIAYFTGLYNINCTINVAISVKGVNISAYTGIITQAATITLGTSGWVQAGGTFTGATQSIDNNGDLVQTLGTYTPTTGTYTFLGATNNGIALSTTYTNGSIVINKVNGTLKQNGSITISNNLSVNSGRWCTNTFNLTISGNLTILPEGIFTKIVGSTVAVTGVTSGQIKNSYSCQDKSAFFLGFN
jgi:hypothetical protein